jgi:hypothetical protein
VWSVDGVFSEDDEPPTSSIDPAHLPLIPCPVYEQSVSDTAYFHSIMHTLSPASSISRGAPSEEDLSAGDVSPHTPRSTTEVVRPKPEVTTAFLDVSFQLWLQTLGLMTALT